MFSLSISIQHYIESYDHCIKARKNEMPVNKKEREINPVLQKEKKFFFFNFVDF